MTNLTPQSIDELSFTIEDLEIFKIEDTKECIVLLRQHFFPRLDYLMQESLELVEELYGVDANTGMSTVYSPNNRLDAAKNIRPDLVMVGRSGKRRNKKNNEPLNITNAQGKSIYIHPAYIRYNYYDNGLFLIEFTPFSHSASSSFVEKFRKKLQDNLSLFLSNAQNIILNFCSSEIINIGKETEKFKALVNTKNFGVTTEKDFSGISFLVGIEAPIDSDCWDFFFRVFLFLYPLFDLCIAIGDGRDSSWVEMMNTYQTIFFEEETEGGGEIKPEFDHEQEDIEKEDQIDFPNLEYESDFDLESLEDERKRKNIEIVQREGQQKFRSNLLNVYGGTCVITGCDVVAALDAAHIVNYSGIDSNHIQNGLLLRRDIHGLFDEKLITIDPESMTIMIAPELIGSHYETLKDIRIRLPKDRNFSPSPDSLRKHRDDFIQKHQLLSN